MTKRIIIVDNDQGFSAILAEGLNNHGAFSAVVINSGIQALQLASERPIDMVIIDLGLEDTPPLKLIQAIRKAKATLPILVTPIIGQPVPDEINTLDIQGTIPKPFFVGDLPKIVGEPLGLDIDSQIPEIPKQSPSSSGPSKQPAEAEEPKAGEAPSPSQRRSRLADAPPPTGDDIPLPTLPSWKLERLRKNEAKVVEALKGLNGEFENRAEVILLTAGSELIAKTGLMGDERAQELAILVARSAAAAAQAAIFLGERDGQFEQSLHEGDQYRLYSYSLGEGVVMSLALSPNVPLGIVRHNTRRTSQTLIEDYIN